MASFVRLTPDRASLDALSQDGVVRAADYASALDADAAVAEAREQAAAIVEAAEAQAAAHLASAEAEATTIREEAEQLRAEAAERGRAEAMAEAETEIAERMLELVDRSVEFLSGSERRVGEIVLLCLRRVLGEFPEEDLVIRQARTALQLVRGETNVTLRVATALEQPLRERVAEILSGHADVGYITVVGDPAIATDGCRLETEVGVVDASLSSQIKALESAIQNKITRQNV